MVGWIALVLTAVAVGATIYAAAPFAGVGVIPLVWFGAALLSTTLYALHPGFAQSDSWSLWLLSAVLLCSPLAPVATARAQRASLWTTLPAAVLGALTLPLLGIGALFVACYGGPGICPS